MATTAVDDLLKHPDSAELIAMFQRVTGIDINECNSRYKGLVSERQALMRGWIKAWEWVLIVGILVIALCYPLPVKYYLLKYAVVYGLGCLAACFAIWARLIVPKKSERITNDLRHCAIGLSLYRTTIVDLDLQSDTSSYRLADIPRNNIRYVELMERARTIYDEFADQMPRGDVERAELKFRDAMIRFTARLQAMERIGLKPDKELVARVHQATSIVN